MVFIQADSEGLIVCSVIFFVTFREAQNWPIQLVLPVKSSQKYA